jgi:ribosome recycling factor
MSDLAQFKNKLDQVIERFQSELKNIRTGRATPALVEDLRVDYYGVPTPLNQVASISASDARSLVISPWSKDQLAVIEKSIRESDLGLNPVNDGNAIRINLPPLTEERRKDLVKLVGKETEEARISLRKAREDQWSELQKQEKAGEISEDQKFQLKDKLQKVVDEYNEKIEELAKKKEEEVMKV